MRLHQMMRVACIKGAGQVEQAPVQQMGLFWLGEFIRGAGEEGAAVATSNHSADNRRPAPSSLHPATHPHLTHSLS